MRTLKTRLSGLPALQHVNWDPDARELKRFAVAMLVGFGVIGGVFAIRAGGVTGLTLALWGAGLALAASTLARALGRKSYLAVYVVSGLIGAVVSRVILVLMFLLVFVPLGVLLRLTGKDFLGRKPGATMWRKVDGERDAYSYYRQF
jgi:hypothetical protein